jgi:dihydrofolate reductase
MSKVFFSVTVSLDGYMAPEWRSDDQWMSQWMQLQDYVFHQHFFRGNLSLGGDGETGEDNRILEETFERTGVTIIGKRMFDLGEGAWPDEAPFHTPVFVLTHQKREPWERPGGTVFHFVNDGYESALRRAREVTGDRDIRIGGGVNTVQQYLNGGLVDEFHLAVGRGRPRVGRAGTSRSDPDIPSPPPAVHRELGPPRDGVTPTPPGCEPLVGRCEAAWRRLRKRPIAGFGGFG